MHTSVQLETPCEIINVVPLNPLISKCQIKVCYVGDDPNRNKSVITKEVAKQMANSLPGSPIVGFYNEASGDFEEHNRSIDISNGKIVVRDTTRPYGFVDLNAKVWFQKYLDDGKYEREYLVTEGYLWTGQYPECQRIIDNGNNQSMELDDDSLDGTWTNFSNGKPKLFIINEAIVSKLCILGENCEPCFEGSNITPTQFSFDNGFKHKIYSMMQELKELKTILNNNKGGTQVFTKYSVTVGDNLWNQLYSNIDHENYSLSNVLLEGDQLFAVLQSRSDNSKYSRVNFSLNEDKVENMSEVEDMAGFVPLAEAQFAQADVEAFEASFKKKEDDDKDKNKQTNDPNSDKNTEGNTSKSGDNSKDDEGNGDNNSNPDDDEDEKKKKKGKYTLEEIPEYVELSNKYSALQADYDALKSEVDGLREFKLASERTQKQEMIDKFYMLSDEDKKDVTENIDKYSLDDIEAKLSVICVRNKVNFNLDDDEHKDAPPTTFNFNGEEFDDVSTPAWVKAAMEVEKEMK